MRKFTQALFGKKKKRPQGRTQTFTYYIPAPKNQRNSGYREKEFDRLFYQFINQGYEILSFHTEAHQGVEQSGMWVICVVRTLKSHSNPVLDFDEDESSPIEDDFKEKIYYIDDDRQGPDSSHE